MYFIEEGIEFILTLDYYWLIIDFLSIPINFRWLKHINPENIFSKIPKSIEINVAYSIHAWKLLMKIILIPVSLSQNIGSNTGSIIGTVWEKHYSYERSTI